MRTLVTAVLLALVLGVAGGCSSGDEEGAAGGTGGGEALVGSASDEAGAGEVARAAPVPASLPQIGPQVIQTASVRLSIRRGRFGETVDEARSIAAGFGGFVVSSTASQGTEQRLVRGTLVLRIPAASYAEAMKSLAGLGQVEARNESGQDVSQEYVDLRARIRQLQAVESQLLELLDRADTVGAALAVQRQLSQIQLELEQARGRLQYLDDRVAFATISLAIHEALAPAPKRDEGGFGVIEAWKKAAHGFLAVVGWTFIILATAAPVLVLVLLLWLLARSAVRRKIGPVWPRLKSD